MAITLFAQNLLETATVTASVQDLTALSRLYDRRIVPYSPAFGASWAMTQISPLTLAMGATIPQQVDIDIDLGSAQPVSSWAIVNHNMAGATVTLRGSSTSPATTIRSSVALTAADMLTTFASQSFRFWRINLPAGSTVQRVGEVMLGNVHTLSLNPIMESSSPAVVGNVARDRTPAGVPRTAKLGGPRARYAYRWNWQEAATDTAAILAVYALLDEGAKALLMRDENGTVRWVEMVDPQLAPELMSGAASGLATNRMALTLEEVPR